MKYGIRKLAASYGIFLNLEPRGYGSQVQWMTELPSAIACCNSIRHLPKTSMKIHLSRKPIIMKNSKLVLWVWYKQLTLWFSATTQECIVE